ncbi:MAG: hypothetical protein ACYCW6_25090 [Candidatus Xenobia bacterium]
MFDDADFFALAYETDHTYFAFIWEADIPNRYQRYLDFWRCGCIDVSEVGGS